MLTEPINYSEPESYVASRLEGMARPGTILVSQDTFRLVRDLFEFKSLGPVQVKGKKEPQQTFELLKACAKENFKSELGSL